MAATLLTRSLRRQAAFLPSLTRSLATASTSTPSASLPSAVPFVQNAIISPSAVTIQPPARMDRILKGKGLMAHINLTLPSPPAKSLLDTLFNRAHPDRLLPGSVLSVTMQHAPTNFSGVLIGVRYKGPDTSFTLRNIIQRTGVEMTFMVCSPALKDIKVVHRAGGGGGRQGRRIRRAKLFYLRDQPGKMTAISTSIKRTQR
ncbi:hypothetical protein FRB90_011696 [Tulasnella sp. 427]|nr:hypothetical protein FRB90_011696 [Tulasnella sp. 427]